MTGWLRGLIGRAGIWAASWAAGSGSASAATPFDGARRDRLLWEWVTAILSPDREIYPSLAELRARARDLARNNDHVAGFLYELETQVVGADGIGFQAALIRPGDPDETPWREVNWPLEEAWKEAGMPEHWTVTGTLSRPETERLIVRTWATDGEVFLRLRPGYDNDYGFAVQLLDADLVDETHNVPPNDRGVEIRMGVEVDRDGRPLAYHVLRRHPRDMHPGLRDDRVRIPADQIIHLFTPYRPGQTRGYSWFAPILVSLRMLAGLQEAELVASRMHAAKGGFIKNMTPEAIEAYVERLKSMTKEEFLRQTRGEPHHPAPGVIPELAPGQEFEQFDPTHPNTAFDPFVRAILRALARGVGSSYATFTGDLSQANYGSMRGGLLPERDRYRVIQQAICVRVCRRVYRSWIRSALLSGAIPGLPLDAPRVPSAYYRVEWKPRGWQWIDPLKDIQASDLEVALGINSRQRIAAEQGRDYEDIVDELAEEQKYAEEAGVYVGGKAQGGGSGSGQESTGGEDDDDDDDDDSSSRNGARWANRLAHLNGRT